MKNYRFYIITALVFISVQCIIVFWSSTRLTKMTSVAQIEKDLHYLKKSTDDYALVFGAAAAQPERRPEVLTQLQKIANGTEKESLQLSAIDWSGTILVHPDITQVGTQVKDETSALGSNLLAFSADSLYTQMPGTAIQPVYLKPLAESDIILIGSMNLQKKYEEVKALRQELFINLSLVGLISLLVLFAVMRWLSLRYENKIEEKDAQFEGSVSSLQKLNSSLERYQEKLASIEAATLKTPEVFDTQEDPKELDKRRILTYLRNELLPVNIEDIAYIYVDSTITYIVQKSGKRSTSSDSLDTIYRHLDAQLFFRVNRQIIVAISAIETITKYGNSQLKLKVTPASDIDMIIGKNKAAAFKQWLDL